MKPVSDRRRRIGPEMRTGSQPGATARAFSLTELLVVVTVLLVLTAVATPSMMDAVVRSKIARTRVDMRTVAQALESYTVDHNRYPDPSPMAIELRLSQREMVSAFDTRLSPPLTTPIPYMTRLAEDLFTESKGANADLHYLLRENVRAMGEDLEDYDDIAAAIPGASPSAVRYMIVSNGPDLDYEPLWIDDDDLEDDEDDGDEEDDEDDGDDDYMGAIYYDPTNGTVSSGDVVEWNR